QVARRPGVEFVFGELLRTPQQAEPRPRHDQVQETGHPADRAVAIAGRDRLGSIHLESDRTAVAAAVVRDIGLAYADIRAHFRGSPRRNGHCSRSTFPPESMIPTRCPLLPNFPASNAATATADDGSISNLRSCNTIRMASTISRSLTVTTSST